MRLQRRKNNRPPCDWDFKHLIGNYASETTHVFRELKDTFHHADEAVTVCAISPHIDSIVEFPRWCSRKRYRLIAFQHPFYLVKKAS